jgi:hypothetical protein
LLGEDTVVPDCVRSLHFLLLLLLLLVQIGKQKLTATTTQLQSRISTLSDAIRTWKQEGHRKRLQIVYGHSSIREDAGTSVTSDGGKKNTAADVGGGGDKKKKGTKL